MARPETPETDKLQKVYNEHPDVQEFLQWLLEGGMIPRISKVETIARYYKIDLSKAAEETRAYLEYYQAIRNQIEEKKEALDYGKCYSEKPEADGQHCNCWWDCCGGCCFCGWAVSPEVYDYMKSGSEENNAR